MEICYSTEDLEGMIRSHIINNAGKEVLGVKDPNEIKIDWVFSGGDTPHAFVKKQEIVK